MCKNFLLAVILLFLAANIASAQTGSDGESPDKWRLGPGFLGGYVYNLYVEDEETGVVSAEYPFGWGGELAYQYHMVRADTIYHVGPKLGVAVYDSSTIPGANPRIYETSIIGAAGGGFELVGGEIYAGLNILSGGGFKLEDQTTSPVLVGPMLGFKFGYIFGLDIGVTYLKGTSYWRIGFGIDLSRFVHLFD